MPPADAEHSHMTWLLFALMTAVAWGLYGIFLHSGQVFMKDPENGRAKAFLFVGIAYFLTAVLAPLVVLWLKGASWDFTPRGMTWSLLAGIAGALGAFCVLLAFGAGGMPSVVMSIIFAGAPIINAVVALSLHPPAGGVSSLRWQFIAGIALAAAGGCLVTLYKPPPARAGPARPDVSIEARAERLERSIDAPRQRPETSDETPSERPERSIGAAHERPDVSVEVPRERPEILSDAPAARRGSESPSEPAASRGGADP